MKTIIHDILEQRFTTRSWSSAPVQEDHLISILEAVYKVPRKNGKWTDKLLVIGDSDQGRLYKQDLYDNYTWTYEKHLPEGTQCMNGQILAPTLLLWYTDYEHPSPDIQVNVGAQSMTALLVAQQLGYNTGFCKCFDTIKIFQDKNIWPLVSLGIGFADKVYQKSDFSKENLNPHFRNFENNGEKCFDLGNVSADVKLKERQAPLFADSYRVI